MLIGPPSLVSSARHTERAGMMLRKERNGKGPLALARKTAAQFVFKPPNVCIPIQKSWSVLILEII